MLTLQRWEECRSGAARFLQKYRDLNKSNRDPRAAVKHYYSYFTHAMRAPVPPVRTYLDKAYSCVPAGLRSARVRGWAAVRGTRLPSHAGASAAHAEDGRGTARIAVRSRGPAVPGQPLPRASTAPAGTRPRSASAPRPPALVRPRGGLGRVGRRLPRGASERGGGRSGCAMQPWFPPPGSTGAFFLLLLLPPLLLVPFVLLARRRHDRRTPPLRLLVVAGSGE
mgnify:CR=1 FL=1